MITVVGLGPAGPGYLTASSLEAVDAADVVLLRTTRHPSAAAVTSRRPDAASFDGLYEQAGTFEEVYAGVVARLLEEAALGRRVCYAVPGSPLVAERSVELLRQAAPGSLGVVIEPAVSFLDLAFARLSLDPLSSGVMLADAASFAGAAAAHSGPLLLAQAWSRQVLSEVKLAVEEVPPRQRAVILHHLGLPDEEVLELDWAEIDRAIEPDHLTSLFVPSAGGTAGEALAALSATVVRLRRDCPWDRQQTHRSLLRHLLEESYEAMEALDGLGDDPSQAPAEAVAHAEEELGDLLCQVVFHATLGAEEGLFSLRDVAASIEEKLVSRHPHVFGDVAAHDAATVVANWEEIKKKEKGRASVTDGIPAALPSLALAVKLQRKSGAVPGASLAEAGTLRADAGALLDALAEVGAETGSATSTRRTEEPENPPAGVAGALLWAVSDLVRRAGVEPEDALRAEAGRFAARLREAERRAEQLGKESRIERRRASEDRTPPPG